MTNDERASLIKKLILPLVIIAIALGIWFYPKSGAEKPEQKVAVASPENGLLIILHHLPGDPASEQMKEILTRVQKKYGNHVIVNHVDFKADPRSSKAQGVTKPPHVVFVAGTEKAYDFQGLWSQVKVEKKVEELLWRIKRVGKDWRPPVPGMKPVGG